MNTSGKIPHDELAAFSALSPAVSPDLSTRFEPYRRELHLHCYRLLGSLHDAEDMVQETMLRAWQHFDSFKGAASLRTWLYTIATNVCLDTLKKRSVRTLPMAAFAQADHLLPLTPAMTEPMWLEPCPDSWLSAAVDNPETVYTTRESISLAFLTVLHVLPPRQRAILILADVLDWPASDVAHMLDISLSAVNSALHRARVTLAKNYKSDAPEMVQVPCANAETHALLTRYVQAWETDDVAGLVALLKEDATLSMPPYPSWYRGREAIGAIFQAYPFGSGIPQRWRLYPTRANGQPAFALYRAGTAQGVYHAAGIVVVNLDFSVPNGQITEMVVFHGAVIVPYFGFPLQQPG